MECCNVCQVNGKTCVSYDPCRRQCDPNCTSEGKSDVRLLGYCASPTLPVLLRKVVARTCTPRFLRLWKEGEDMADQVAVWFKRLFASRGRGLDSLDCRIEFTLSALIAPSLCRV